MNILIIYTAVQLLSAACMLAISDKIRPEINRIIENNGYNVNKVNTMLEFNDKLGKILKGLIPLYYAFLSMSLIINKNKIESYALNEIKTGKYEKTNNIDNTTYDEEDEYIDDSVINENFKVNIRPQKQYNWNLPLTEKYVARRNNNLEFEINEIPNETKEETITKEFSDEECLSPFTESAFIKPEIQKIEDTIEEKTIKPEIIEEKEEEQEVKKEVKETITNKDIAKAIASLNYKQLDELDAKIRYLSELKKNKKLILDKDIA